MMSNDAFVEDPCQYEPRLEVLPSHPRLPPHRTRRVTTSSSDSTALSMTDTGSLVPPSPSILEYRRKSQSATSLPLRRSSNMSEASVPTINLNNQISPLHERAAPDETTLPPIMVEEGDDLCYTALTPCQILSSRYRRNYHMYVCVHRRTLRERLISVTAPRHMKVKNQWSKVCSLSSSREHLTFLHIVAPYEISGL